MYYYSLVLDWGDESVVERFQDVNSRGSLIEVMFWILWYLNSLEDKQLLYNRYLLLVSWHLYYFLLTAKVV